MKTVAPLLAREIVVPEIVRGLFGRSVCEPRTRAGIVVAKGAGWVAITVGVAVIEPNVSTLLAPLSASLLVPAFAARVTGVGLPLMKMLLPAPAKEIVVPDIVIAALGRRVCEPMTRAETEVAGLPVVGNGLFVGAAMDWPLLTRLLEESREKVAELKVTAGTPGVNVWSPFTTIAELLLIARGPTMDSWALGTAIAKVDRAGVSLLRITIADEPTDTDWPPMVAC